VLLSDCAERASRRNLIVIVTKLRQMPPRTVEHRAESDDGQMWRREIGHDGGTLQTTGAGDSRLMGTLHIPVYL
jgi:hypothetical protein